MPSAEYTWPTKSPTFTPNGRLHAARVHGREMREYSRLPRYDADEATSIIADMLPPPRRHADLLRRVD